jgi:hypothetical protein
MRNVRIICGLALAACALDRSAASALAATEFTANRLVGKEMQAPPPFKLLGKSVGPQEFVFKKIHVTCEGASAKGELTPPSKTLALTVKYTGCMTGPIIVWGKKLETGMKFKGKSEYTYHDTGWVENEEEVEMKAKYLGCLVEWDSGVYPEKADETPEDEEKEWGAVHYKNEALTVENIKKFPLGKQHKLLISNNFKGLEWSELGGGLCEDPEIELAEGEKGKATGKILVEVPGGNLEGPETGE